MFNLLLQSKAEKFADAFVSKDINLDGFLNVSGFKSAVIETVSVQENKLSIQELNEIFLLISEQD